MPVHDWTRVEAGIFHSFHNAWITHLSEALNRGVLPPDYYALGEQHAGRIVADVLTLHARLPNDPPAPPPFDATGGIALAEAPPQVRRQLTGSESYRQRRRSLSIRHVSGHRLVALIEIVSPANKDRPESVEALVGKTLSALELGVHVLLVDLLPPGRHDPRGMHGAVWDEYDEAPYDFPLEEPFTLASYAAGPPVKAFLEHLSVGDELPEIPLFLTNEKYVPTPLRDTYLSAFQGMPAYWRDVVEGRKAADT
jgi:hypothetical protein